MDVDDDVTADPPLDRPLDGVLVLDFSQFLAGPVAAVRLADLGARVIKVERPGTGDIGRRLAFAGMELDGDTLSWQVMNRDKEGFAADLKAPDDLAAVRELVARADVLVHNFRPGVMERLGLGPEEALRLNPRLVHASVTGYGTTGPWRDVPGQDLLAQAVSGLPWLSGSRTDGPVPVGVSVADLLASIHLAHGVTALLLRRERTGRGGVVETSLLEGLLDLQFELLAAHLTDPATTVRRGGPHSAHAFLAAPYGVYPTSDGFLALAMNPLPVLGDLLDLPALRGCTDPQQAWTRREEFEDLLATHLRTRPTQAWLDVLQPADVWCAPVLTLPDLVASEGFATLEMTQEVHRPGLDGARHTVATTRSPLRVDGQVLGSRRGAPRLGEHTGRLRAEFGLDPGPGPDPGPKPGPLRERGTVGAGEPA